MIKIEKTTDIAFFSQKIRMRRIYSNKELNLHHYFHQKTNIYPENVISINQFIFFFIKNEDYFDAKLYLNSIRKQLEKKVLLIRAEKTLIKLLFSFFPDPYIHDIEIEIIEKKEKKLKFIIIYFLSFEERGIAIGRKGDYIKTVNDLFKKYIILKEKTPPIRIKCQIVNLGF